MGRRALNISIACLFVSVVACSSDEHDAAPAKQDDAGGVVAPRPQGDGSAPSTDGGAAKEASTPTTGACTPQDVATFKPLWKQPNGFHQKKCNQQQIALLSDCVWSHPGRDDAACKAFFDSNEDTDEGCIKCAYTPTSSPKLGAVISTSSSVQVNFGGCIALLTGDVTEQGCGAKMQASDLCQDKSCVDVCPVPDGDDAAFDAFVACEDGAKAGVCKSYADAASCGETVLGDGGVAKACLPDTSDFGERVAIYADIFCGGMADAGGD